jgi:large subunit ribosomal protein L9
MKVLLLKNVKTVGEKGKIYEVKDGYARNFLFPNNLACEANDGVLRQLEMQKLSMQKRETHQKEESIKIAEKLKNLTLILNHKAGNENKLFGSITSHEIVEALKMKEIFVDKKQVILDEPIRFLGNYTVKIKLESGVMGVISLSIQKLS